MSRGWQIFLTIATAIILPGGIWVAIGVKALMQICYNLVKFQIKHVDLKTLITDLEFTLKIKNPSNLKVIIEGYDINISLNDTSIGNVKKLSPTVIESKKYSLLTIPVSVDLKKSFGKIKSLEIVQYFMLKQYDKIFVYLTGKLNAKLLNIPLSVKIDYKYTLSDVIKATQSDTVTEKC